MPTLREIEFKIEEGESLKDITSAYAEISAIKLRKIKNNIQRNQKFVKELSKLFYIVREEASKRKILPEIGFEGTAHIIITSNYPFYGALERKLMTEYLKKANLLTPQLRIVIGRTGNYFFELIKAGFSFEKFILKKDIPSLEELEKITKKVKKYKNVLVFHTVFSSLAVQRPTFTNITKPFLSSSLSKKEKSYHIFEPEIKEMFEFFNSQIIQVLLDQTFLESELARTASRLISMNEAEEKAKEFIKKQIRELKILKRNLINFKFLEIFKPAKEWREKNYYGR